MFVKLYVRMLIESLNVVKVHFLLEPFVYKSTFVVYIIYKFIYFNNLFFSAVILTEKLRKCEQFFSKGFSTDYGRYRSQLTTKYSQEKYSVIFVQNVCKVAHPETDFKIGFS